MNESIESEIKKELEDFFEQTCINNYTFRRDDASSILQMKKKTPIGTWQIRSLELGYFIDPNDQIIIGILNKGSEKDYQIISNLLEKGTK